MVSIFISYRRADSLAIVGRIADCLRARFGSEALFMDLDTIPFGADFRAAIHNGIGESAVLLAVIGERWLAATPDGTRRLDDANDFVRIEIETALARGIPVIPLLIGGTAMPGERDLPVSLAALAYRNALPVDPGRDFHVHMNRLLQAVGDIIHNRGTPALPASAAASRPASLTTPTTTTPLPPLPPRVRDLLAQLASSDQGVKKTAVEELGKVGHPGAIPFLIEVFKDRQTSFVNSSGYALADALGRLGPAAVDPLLELLHDYPHARFHAITALSTLKDPRAIHPLIEVMRLPKGESSPRALQAIGPAAVEPLIVALSDEHPLVRRGSASALSGNRDRRVVRALIVALDDRDDKVQLEAVRALGACEDVAALDALLLRLKDNAHEMRIQVVHALARLGDRRAVEPLIGCLKDEHEKVRMFAIIALGKVPQFRGLGDERAIGPIIGTLSDDNPEVRSYAAQALMGFNDRRAVGPLISAFQNECQPMNRQTLAHVLRSLTGENIGDDQAQWQDWWQAKGLQPEQ